MNDNKNNNEINLIASSETDLNKINIQKMPENSYMTSIDIIKKNYCMYDLDNSFAIFKLKNDHLYIAYPLLHDFLCFDLDDEVVIATIKNAHDFFVLNFRYIYDNFSKRDLLQTISGEDNNLKLWDIETWECLLNINANRFGIMFSACFLYDDYEKQNFLVTSNCTGNNYIQIFDYKGKKIKNIPYYEDSEKNSENDDENNFNNNDNNNSNENINFDNNSENNFINNENNNEFDNSENNNEEKSDNENININDDNFNNFNKDEEIQDNKSMNSNDINNEKDEKKFEKIKGEENYFVNEERENEKDENINIINKENNFIFKYYENKNKEEENIINDNNNEIKINTEHIEEDKDDFPKMNIFNNDEKINSKKLEKENEVDENINNIKINENVNFNINNYAVNDNDDIDINQNIHLNKSNIEEKEKEEEENNKNNILENEIINNKDENFINNEQLENLNTDNEINTSTKENNNDINNNIDQEQNNNNNNSNISNNDNLNENENNNEIIIDDISQNKKPEIDHIYYIESYYDKKTCITYIISCCSECVKSFNYNTNILYHIYQENEKEKFIHGNVIIDDSAQNNNNLIKLIETCNDGYIRIWDFHIGDLLNKIKICEEGIKSICLWDENNIFVGCDDTTIKLVNVNSNEITHILYGHKQRVCCLKKIEHKKYGKCLISKGWGGDFIKLWKKKE